MTSKEAIAHYKLGLSHLNADKLQPAFVEFQTALALDSGNKEIHSALGTVYLRLEDLDSAIKHYREAVRLDPSYSDAYNNICYVQYQRAEYEGAIKNCRKALSNPLYLTPEKAFYNIGRSYYRLSRYEEAIKAFQDALRRYPGLHLAYYGMALSRNALKEYGAASAALTTAIDLDPRFRGDLERAARMFLSGAAPPLEAQDLKDYLEILKY